LPENVKEEYNITAIEIENTLLTHIGYPGATAQTEN
jgi:hypothetical protein